MTNEDKKQLIEKLLIKHETPFFRVEVDDSFGVLVYTGHDLSKAVKDEISFISGDNAAVGFRAGAIEIVQGKEVNLFDMVNKPPHYNFGKIEVIEFIEDQKLNYHVGNTIKYLCRAGRKDASKLIEDLEKAAWYLNRHIEVLKAEKEQRPMKRPNEMSK